MSNTDTNPAVSPDIEQIENQEWLESLDYVLQSAGPKRVAALLERLEAHATQLGVEIPFSANTPYINTIPPGEQPKYPGDRELERRLRNAMRWNAMAMVVRANKQSTGIGGHISTFASSATLYDVAQNHFFKGKDHPDGGDLVYFQGHASPGMYARAFLEGRLSEAELINFRQELRGNVRGLSSYPHPWLMPDFWEFPTVSMGLGPIGSIYQARFNRYLTDRGIKDTSKQKVWCFIGDGETDEPETTGAISLPAREKLDNLIWVINCNLQRLDGPVRGNGKIIQELETLFRGAGWNVIKVLWGTEWDVLLDQDNGDLVAQMGRIVDGQYQKYTVSSGDYVREHFFGATEHTRKLAEQLSDEQIRTIRRGGHDPEKVFAAYLQATQTKGQPTVVLAKTVKGYGMGEVGEGKNSTHGQKTMPTEAIKEFRDRFRIPIADEDIESVPFYKPAPDSPEMQYLMKRREELGGFVPERRNKAPQLPVPSDEIFKQFLTGTDPKSDKQPSTTQVMVGMMQNLLRDQEIGKYIVPIVPDEARTFGMEGLIGRFGIYSSIGQLYEPVDRQNVMYYKESKTGQILEEGINEAGSMASFIAAGTSYATHGVPMIPLYIYYSMFGQQRVGDQFWLAGDIRAKGFLLGGTAGRTTLAGEGLQHQDGHSHLMAYAVPNMLAYDPAFAYELAVVMQDGLKRMFHDGESIFYYVTLMNEQYVMPPMPQREGTREGILRGMYLFRTAEEAASSAPETGTGSTEQMTQGATEGSGGEGVSSESPNKTAPLKRGKTPAASVAAPALRAQLFGSGTILNEVIKAQTMLAAYGVSANVWSITSYQQIYRDAQECERHNLLHPGQDPKVPFLTQQLASRGDVVVASSDYVKALPESISQYVPYPMACLGTDGFGRSDGRAALRDFFEVDARYVTLAALTELAKIGKLPWETVQKAMSDLGIDAEKLNPHLA
ncbi:pyruvate dehydrogenase E1 component [Abditibacterium utsteinense]|uniref:Pyruvate dehydrogenase E1 component n=1 Tax=Abditibacterium utsteinense TaxID=1960156 RepID=A0A2S8STG0_9BACT|nr:pyruvate dehydrogenase (acetyl-transferring), homodimeric type [Abditibacterium utsteinense]PQV64093.1 pyruvate dehydrogenase E1 component [Abditibacterium utsteinense]